MSTELQKAPEPPASTEEITKLVLEVEVSKQLRPQLNDQQRTLLVRDLAKFKFTLPELRERAMAVKCTDTYNSIALNYWVKDYCLPKMVIEQERAELRYEHRKALSKITQHIEQSVREHFDELRRIIKENVKDNDEALELELLDEALREQHLERERHRENLRLKVKERMGKAKRVLRSLSKTEREAVLTRAVAKGIFVGYDPHIVDNIQLFAVELLSVVEEMNNELKAGSE
jgi:hypothetical protein